MSRNNYQYYVEGPNEKKLVDTLKVEGRIASGKSEVFNMIQELFTNLRIMALKPNTIVILIFDTDIIKTDVLEKNIRFLKKQKNIREVLCIPQIKNLEEELVFSCNVKSALFITNSKSSKDFKHDFCSCTNLNQRLQKCGFELEKLWSRHPSGDFKNFSNEAKKIKL